jgi:branched-chain amino acid aminotransferase
LTLNDLYSANEMFCTGTMGELAGVTSLDGKPVGNGEIGPMTQRLSALFEERTRKEGFRIV